MTRLSIENLPKPAARFRPSKATTINGIGFETKSDAKAEQQLRIKLIKNDIRKSQASGKREETAKLKLVRKVIRRRDNMASPVYMRKHRIKITGHLMRHVADHPGKVSMFTIIPRNWEFRGGDLAKANPIIMLSQLRQALMREGASTVTGWLFLAIHGEHEPNEDVYRLHVHGIASDGMIKVVSALRKRRNYKSTRRSKTSDKVYQRVKVTRKALTNLPSPITYVVQSYWPAKSIYKKDDLYIRHKSKRRIKFPRHTEVLLWLSKWRLRDVTLMVAMQVGKQGLLVNHKPYTNGEFA